MPVSGNRGRVGPRGCLLPLILSLPLSLVLSGSPARGRRPGATRETIADVPHGDLRGVHEGRITAGFRRVKGMVNRQGDP